MVTEFQTRPISSLAESGLSNSLVRSHCSIGMCTLHNGIKFQASSQCSSFP